MFRVRWAKSVIKEYRCFTTMVIPEAKSKSAGANVTAKNEPWVLASKVDQCFFITDPSKPSRIVEGEAKETSSEWIESPMRNTLTSTATRRWKMTTPLTIHTPQPYRRKVSHSRGKVK